MRWLRALSVVAVLLVIGMALGSVATWGLELTSWTETGILVPGAITLLVVAGGLAVLVVLGGPNREWVGNPYW